MEKRIELERRGRPAEKVEELNLDNARATQISGLTDDFVKLKVLSMINVGLTTLKGFPALPSLTKLELSDNRISGGLNYLQGCPKLQYINLSGNKIKDMDTLDALKELTELRSLDLFGCEVTSADDYRESTFEKLKSLVYLDGANRANDEADDDEEDDDYDEFDDLGEDDDDGDEDGDGEDGVNEDGDDDDDDDDDDDEFDDEEEDGLDDDDDDGLDDLDDDDDDDDTNLNDVDEDEVAEDGDDDEEQDEGADEEQTSRGVKRKLEEEEEDGED